MFIAKTEIRTMKDSKGKARIEDEASVDENFSGSQKKCSPIYLHSSSLLSFPDIINSEMQLASKSLK